MKVIYRGETIPGSIRKNCTYDVAEDHGKCYSLIDEDSEIIDINSLMCEVIEEQPSNGGVYDAPEWSGEGLPPVGTVCEVRHAEGWRECEIIAHFENRVATVAAYTITLGDNGKILDCAIERCFRPIKSEKDKEIESIKNALDYHSITYMGLNQELAEHLYNAGFRLTKDSK